MFMRDFRSGQSPSSSPRPKAKPPPHGMAATGPPRKMPPVAKAAAAAAASTAPPAPMRNPTTTAVPPQPKSLSYKAPPGPLVYKQPPAAVGMPPSPGALAKGVRGVKAPPGPRPNGEGEREMEWNGWASRDFHVQWFSAASADNKSKVFKIISTLWVKHPGWYFHIFRWVPPFVSDTLLIVCCISMSTDTLLRLCR